MKKDQLTFTVVSRGGNIPSRATEEAFLVTDNWNDWHRFQTMYQLFYVDENKEQHRIGSVKIGQFSMRGDQARPEIPAQFESLDEHFFSLGQDESYYENLNKFDGEIRNQILASLRDVAKDLELLARAEDEEVMRSSLRRDISLTTVRGQFHRMTQGGARVTQYHFEYIAPISNDIPPLVLKFRVKPESNPPTNIHVLIGRNGVGKTRLLNLMTRVLLKRNSAEDIGTFNKIEIDSSRFSISELDDSLPFSNLVTVTFSAFDPFEPYSPMELGEQEMQYAYIGLKRTITDQLDHQSGPKDIGELAEEFANSLYACRYGAKAARWKRALEVLETDPVFMEAGVSALIGMGEDQRFISKAADFFDKKLSSGHKLVLLIITRLIETVEEKTLVLMDEPEAHLHPPLLSAFVRALSDLMVNRNGVALIATHSPVVLQEVPKSCVWKLRRTGYAAAAERPEIETFGENIGILTREIFGFEVTQSGFHKLLEETVQQAQDFDSVLERFNSQLGSEALAIVRGLIAAQDSERNES